MKLLYDKIIKQDWGPLDETLNRATAFNVDNIAEYFYMSKKDVWDLATDFPTLAPPFEFAFYEYQMPRMGLFPRGLRFLDNAGMRIGALCVAHDVKKFNDGRQWALEFILFLPSRVVNKYGFAGSMRVAVDEDGKYVPLPGLPAEDGVGFVYHKSFLEDMTEEEFKNEICWMLGPIFMAISFMHCKNVTTIEQGAGLNSGKRARHTPSVRYHVLNIEPMKKVLKTEGKSDEVGLKKALHICRGHFKDFRETGLFGKFHDIYWWDSQVRGRAENGVVLKDYKINQPKQLQQGAN